MKKENWEIFPNPNARVLLDKFQRYSLRKENEIAVLLSCAIFEILMTSFLKFFMSTRNINNRQQEVMLKKFRNITSKVNTLFKNLIGKPFETALQETNFKDFYSIWRKVKESRDNFAHGSPHSIGSKTAKMAFEMVKSSFSLFAWLNNKYCVLKND